MSDTVIKVDNLSKQYHLGTIGSGTLYRDIQSWWARTRGKEDPNTKLGTWDKSQMEGKQSFWALKDVSFKIKQGDVVGIIGRNGAGKSTLLKILSRVTGPTSGSIKIKGRVASLLEVGTGFHPELTGRENVYLNGTILGMRKSEIDRKFDEIVEFAEIEKFINTPVKRYSSGMYVRLAFAVAAHLDPEILIVDEVLAVGDFEFQKKCIGKMGEASKSGRTVLFVSHNIQAVRQLCNRGILLENGHIKMNADIDIVTAAYTQGLQSICIDEYSGINNQFLRRGSGCIRFTSVRIKNVCGEDTNQFKMGDAIQFYINYKIYEFMRNLSVTIALKSGMTGEMLTTVNHILTNVGVEGGSEGKVVLELPSIAIRPGEYPLYIWIGEIDTEVKFDVLDNLTAPIIIDGAGKPPFRSGYFSIPSKVLVYE